MQKKQTKENRQFLGIWIPKEIYLNKELNWTDKILVVEINSLDNERGCFASNDYFAEFLGVTKTTISTSISKLKKMGFIKQISFDGRTRVLKAVFKQIENQTLNQFKGSVKPNLKHNNTTNKTTIKTPIKQKKQTLQTFGIDVFENGTLNKIESEKFIDYWGEQNSSGKMRFQLQKTWDLNLRIKRWLRNTKDQPQNSKIHKQVDAHNGAIEMIKKQYGNK